MDMTVPNDDYHRAALWLAEAIEKAQEQPTTQVVELTPALASVLLSRNENNRNINRQSIEGFTRDIENGGWAFNGEPVIVSREGLLNDGQHRCTAVVAANASIKVVLVIGVERATRTTLDQGRTRRLSDYLAMDGYTNTFHLATVATFCSQYQQRGHLLIGGGGRSTKGEVRAFIDANPALQESVAKVQVKGADPYGGRSLLAFCHWVFWQRAGRESADEFVDKVIHGDGLMARDPILYLRNRLVAERKNYLNSNARAELIFRAWNAWRRHETPSRLPINGGPLPVLES